MAMRSIWAVVLVAGVRMQVKVDFSALQRTTLHEYAVRFVVGGSITAIAGIIAKEFGASVGGLFLAFPAIFPASVTLIEKHEREKKEEHGLDGTEHGKKSASVDAAGSAMGSIGLLIFAISVWQFLPNHRSWLVLAGATLSWFTASILLWRLRKRF
jgi:hypothetical protein